MNPKTLSVFLGTPPYGYQNAETVRRLAEAALANGHRVRIFASADAVHIAERGQHPAGLPDALAGLTALIERGAQVELCGSCLRMRGLSQERLAEGARPSSLKGLFTAVGEAHAFLSFGG
ncbi:MAG: DsrE family protein [Chloroflexi bacterium]|nr:DsrE family protein [Chloroflexota bacterium]